MYHAFRFLRPPIPIARCLLQCGFYFDNVISRFFSFPVFLSFFLFFASFLSPVLSENKNCVNVICLSRALLLTLFYTLLVAEFAFFSNPSSSIPFPFPGIVALPSPPIRRFLFSRSSFGLFPLLMILISSSSFPSFFRSLNLGEAFFPFPNGCSYLRHAGPPNFPRPPDGPLLLPL